MTAAERARVARAITSAEDGTTGRIAVRVIPDKAVDAFERAKHEFARTGLHRHDGENATLILIAPKARQFAVVGDRALHALVGDPFWNAVVEESRAYFARGAITEGVLHAVGRVGEALHAHFPAPSDGPP
ncbi:MAG TPA: TPM domain-containing protein [Candidatus Tumulicola sp.]